MPKVLIVEDSVLLADLLEDFLTFQGYEVCGLARTVDEAVALADHHSPDLAVLDFRLSDGEYGSQIRPLLKDKINMGILYVSGDPLENKLTKEDGDAYIRKPYSLKDLARALSVIQEIKANPLGTPSAYPNCIHLLEMPGDAGRQTA